MGPAQGLCIEVGLHIVVVAVVVAEVVAVEIKPNNVINKITNK